ncbi:MAG TPA: glutathione binding-like protein, partial [Stellaceae bacterium]|nr:glutathione binding-like protein [Stellaceae bacterium]
IVIWESNTIMRYLCATHDGARLHPQDPGVRSLVERWMDWQLASLAMPMGTLLMGYYRTPPEKRDLGALEAARQRSQELWAIAEHELEGRRFMAGDALTLADIALASYVHRWHQYPIERAATPRLTAWYHRLGERPGFKTHIAGPVS